MKSALIIGILLIVLGTAALSYRGVTYTTREKVLQLGPLQATAETEKVVPIPRAIGIVAIAGGVALVLFGVRRR